MKSIKRLQKGFTLIELLIVIAVIGVLAAIVFAAIDPLDKINAANDARVQSDLNALAQAEERYATQNLGNYTTFANLQTAGELRVIPTAPTNYTYTLNPAAPAAGAAIVIYSPLKSKKYVNASPSTPFWVYCSSSGKAGATTSSSTCP